MSARPFHASFEEPELRPSGAIMRNFSIESSSGFGRLVLRATSVSPPRHQVTVEIKDPCLAEVPLLEQDGEGHAEISDDEKCRAMVKQALISLGSDTYSFRDVYDERAS